jgi:hypothetical protein
MKTYILNVLTAIDQLASALLGGDEDETLSSRLGKAQRGDFGKVKAFTLTPFAWVVNLAFLPIERQWNHCIRHIEEDEGKNEVLL